MTPRHPRVHARCRPWWASAIVASALAILIWPALIVPLAGAANAQEARTNRIRIEYVPPKNPELQGVFDTLKANRGLERMQEVFAPFRLSNDLNLRAMECGMSNAWYQRPTVTICYEYLDDIRKSVPPETTAAGVTPLDAVLGQFFYVVAHEIGHAMFDFLNVPLWGRAEDAADGFATFIMLQFGKPEARRLIGGAAYSYKNYVQNPKVTVKLEAFSEAHGAPMQRFYNMLCLAFGADPQTFGDLVGSGYLPEARARGCRMEFGEANFAFQQTILPNVDREMGRAVLQGGWMPAALQRPDLPPPPPPGAPK
jgi:hypothetical protein